VREALSAEPILAGGLVDPAPEPVITPLMSPPLPHDEAVGFDLILEGFLLHHGRPRQLAIDDSGRRVLAGDYCYAEGLVRMAASGDLVVIEELADLIALGAAAVADGRREALAPLWAGTVATIRGRRAGEDPDDLALRLSAAKRALRTDGDPRPLAALADVLPHVDLFTEVFAGEP
jgi:hypothetical protein